MNKPCTFHDNALLVKAAVTILLLLPFLFYRYSSDIIGFLPFGSFLQAYPASLLLPAGISFYTFQLIGLVYDDVKDLKPVRWNETLLFTAFFPQLIAGPIEKLAHIALQCHQPYKLYCLQLLWQRQNAAVAWL